MLSIFVRIIMGNDILHVIKKKLVILEYLQLSFMLATKSYQVVFEFVKQNDMILHDIKHCDIYILVLAVLRGSKSTKYPLIETWCQRIISDASMASPITFQIFS